MTPKTDLTKEEFIEILKELEIMVVEAFLWPTGLIVDPEICKSAFKGSDNVNFTKYKLPLTQETVPVIKGKKGQFRLKFSKLADNGK